VSGNATWRLNFQTQLLKLVRHTVFIDRFKQTRPQRSVHAKCNLNDGRCCWIGDQRHVTVICKRPAMAIPRIRLCSSRALQKLQHLALRRIEVSATPPD
jgi:hypothetical protein